MISCRLLLMALAGVCIFSSVEVMGQAERVQRRQERLALADKEWSDARVQANLYYRVPVVEVIGFLATHSTDDEKLVRFVRAVRPIEQQLQELRKAGIKGRTMPADVEAQLDQLQARLYAEVQAVYGSEGLRAVTDFINVRNERISSGFFGIGGGP